MCGINGILSLKDPPNPIDLDELQRARDTMTLRGPDACGHWRSADQRIGLGHRRLAIIDLSPLSNQPMSWADGRYWIVFNGETYNYRELRKELQENGTEFRSHGDTEVILALYAQYGPSMLLKLRGMFALAIWDQQDQRLFLARDAFGIKPLYYATDGNCLRFGSQVKALEASGVLSTELDPAGVVGFLLWGSVPEPFTIRRAIRALPAGHYLLVERGRVGVPEPYLRSDQLNWPQAPTIADALEDSIRAHLVADVQTAVFLSAGLDSSLIAALAARHSPQPLTTITVRFESFKDTPWDEGPIAAQIAHKLGTHHIERTIGMQDFPDLWTQVLQAMDQPSIDGFNTYVISRMAHETGVKVVLSGLGGDELFGGYGSFRQVPEWAWRSGLLKRIPGLPLLWPGLARALRSSQPKTTGILRWGGSLPGAYLLRRGLYLPEELPGLIGKEMAESGLSAYDPITSTTRCLEDRWYVGQDPDLANDDWQRVQSMEACQYMRNQLLRDADWASMAHSLELRVPLVDAWLWRQLAAHRFEPARSGGKAAAVQAAVKDLPDTVWNRAKSGFLIPVADWLQPTQSRRQARSWGRDSRQIAQRVLQAFVPQLDA